MFGLDYPVVNSGSVLTAIDTYNTAMLNNGAANVLGGTYMEPLNPASLSQNGIGLNRFVKYVRYNPTTTQALLGGPALVYWKDETFTTVTPTLSEAFTTLSNAVAGWLLPNTGTTPGLTAATLNGNFCFIRVGGFLAGASVISTTVAGDALIGATGSFTTARIANHAALTNDRIAGYALTAYAAGFADLNVPYLN